MDKDHDGASPASAVERRPLPDMLWLSLAEALTWIAFGDAMAQNDLREQVEGHRPPIKDAPEERLRQFFAGQNDAVLEVPGIGYFNDRQVGLDRLTLAWRQLRDAVDLGTVRVHGRFTRKYSLSDPELANFKDFTGNVIATFSQFDVSTGGIRRQPLGSPDVIWHNDPHSFDREFGDDPRAASGYLMVEVRRDHLIAVFPPCAAPTDSTIEVTSTTGAENECRAWLENQFAADPNKQLSKDDFRTAALTRFNGRLSARGFNNRVWPALAQKHGRTSPGAKRKS